MDDLFYMKEALKEAYKAYELGEVPIGALIVKDDKIISRAHNSVERDGSSLSHAELKAIGLASKELGNFRLTDCTIYTSLEPCVMCAGALVYARIARLVFAAYDKKRGACGSLLNLCDYEGLNHKVSYQGGLLEEESLALIQKFFKELRERKKS
ncbi:MAG: tRNA adenosine(34) deaminase TadA [Finegoldia sp.]|nr:tRNA adenosine(34) deaminase TadA [Finegoldia sp.]